MPWISLVPQPRAALTAQAQPQKPRDWYKISNVADDEAEILVYDEIGGWFGGGAEDFVRELRDVRASRLNVRINSPGGSVFDGVTMANALRAHPATVTVQVDGIAASIASVIALAGDRLVMMPQSQLMIHDASGLSIGNAADMREMADLLDRQSDNIAEAYADKAGGTVEDWRALMRAETWYSAREAVDAGLADELVTLPVRQPEEEPGAAMRNEWDLSVFRYAGRKQAPQPPLPTAAPAPAPPTPVAPVQPAAGLESDVASILGPDVVAALRAIVTPQPAVDPADTAVPKHSTATADGTWDGPAAEKALPSPVPVAKAKQVYGWYDGDQVEDGAVPRSACKLPHHEVSEDGTPGAANLNGVRNALARLPQSDIPEAERAAVEAHLQAHLNAGGGAEDHVHDEPAAAVEPETEPAPAELDDWARSTAHLTRPSEDDWAALVAHLTAPDPEPLALSSGAATA